MKKDKLIPIVVGATALGVVGALVGQRVFSADENALKPDGSHEADWWRLRAEPALWRFGVTTARKLAQAQVADAAVATRGELADLAAQWFDVVDDETLSLMRREERGEQNSALVGPAVEAVVRVRAYSFELRMRSVFMGTAPATESERSEFRTQVEAIGRALDAAHYAIGEPAAEDGGWFPDVDALDVLTMMNPIVLSARLGAWGLEAGAGAAGSAVSGLLGEVAGSAIGALGNLAGGILRSPLGAVVIGGGALYLLRGKLLP